MAFLETNNRPVEFGQVVHDRSLSQAPSVLVLCEHASNRIPAGLSDLGLPLDALQSHIAWDPGALPLAHLLAEGLQAAEVWGGVSRLVYDCNRPPDAPSAMPARSEVYDIPGNAALTAEDRTQRVRSVYTPFCAAVQSMVAQHHRSLQLMVTVHSFTPMYHGQPREVEVGILHGRDDRFAAAMMGCAPVDTPWVIRLNEPYAATDGVAHSLDLHGLRNGLLNVMIEVRNDLLATPDQQQAVADLLIPWLHATRARLEAPA